jgi:hypothetical protein
LALLDDEDDESAGTVDAFDAAELDVRRGRRTGDERDRPALEFVGGDQRERFRQ